LPLVSAGTRMLVDGYFHMRARTLPGESGADAIAGFDIEGATGADNRLDSAVSLSGFVGRAAERGTLWARWRSVQQGARRSLLLRGDAGLGKSRLVRDLRERVAGAAPVFELRCLPEFSQTPFHPVLSLLAAQAGFAAADSEHAKGDKLAALLGRRALVTAAASGDEILPLLADALQLSLDAPSAALQLAPARQREKTSGLLLDLLSWLAGGNAALLIVEDLHWCDPSTLELLVRHLGSTAAPPLLTVLTTRPDGAALSADEVLDLPPLAPAEIAGLVAGVDAGLSAPAVEQIVAWSDGVPLFAEEMARMSAQGGMLPGELAAPLSLQELLAARLDSRGVAAKATAQLAAALGRDFSLDLLKPLSPMSGEALAQSLQALQDAGLVLAKEGGYQFKHALIQDAAYQSLTRGDRRDQHRRIAQCLLAEFPALVESRPDMLARHWSLAGAAAQAIDAWLHAGRWAAHRSAYREAASHFEAGLALLDQLPERDGRLRQELALHIWLGNMRVATQGYGSASARDCFAHAVRLSPQLGEDAAAFPVIFGLWQGGHGDRVTAAPLELVDKLARIATATGDAGQRIVVDYAYGNNLFWLARYDDAAMHLENAVAAPEQVDSAYLLAHYGEETRILSRCFLAWTRWFQGWPDQARIQMARALDDAWQLGHALSLGFALGFATTLQRHLGDPAEAERLARELAALAEEHALSLWGALSDTVIGWARARRGEADGLLPIRRGVEAARIAMPLVAATFRSFLLDALVALGQHAEALECAEATIGAAEAYEDRYLLPELMRLQAASHAVLYPERGDETQALLGRALSLAQQQGALLYELRIACDLAALPGGWHSDVVRASLCCVYARCQEGFDTPDLRRAAALLEAVAPVPDDGVHVPVLPVA
jgi:hypothetical protein